MVVELEGITNRQRDGWLSGSGGGLRQLLFSANDVDDHGLATS
jgi:hypothetical protein